MQKKLSEIFSIVLELPEDTDMMSVRKMSTPRWDSLAQTSLFAAIESEFSITLEPQDFERLTSFEGALLLIEEKL